MAANERQVSGAGDHKNNSVGMFSAPFGGTGLGGDWKFWMFLLLAAANLAPIWMVTYVPGLDLPNHAFAAVLHTLAPTDVRSEYFHTQWIPSPYSLFFLVMSPLIKVFGNLAALKIVLSLAIVGIPLSALLFMHVYNPKHWEWAFVSFIFVFTFHFEYGFIPYVLGIPLVLAGLALFQLVAQGHLSKRLLITSAVVTTLVYLSHVVNIIALTIGAAILIIANAGYDRQEVKHVVGRTSTLWRLMAVYLPTLVLFLVFLLRLPENGVSVGRTLAAIEYRSVFHQLQGPIRVFFSVKPMFDLLMAGCVCGVIAVLFLLKKSRWSNGLPFWLGIVYFAVTLVMPRVHFLGGTDLSSRLAVFGFLSVLASLSLETKGAKNALIGVAVLFVVANVIFRTQYNVRTSRLTEQHVRATTTYIPARQKVLTTYCGYPAATLKPLLHAISWYHIEKGGFSPFLLFGNPAATGVAAKVQLPALSEEWEDRDTLAMGATLPKYDYLVATTCGSPLPSALAALPDSIVYQDSVCTIWKLGMRNGLE
jgi:hypothetical protein